jgi:hypothetical protein
MSLISQPVLNGSNNLSTMPALSLSEWVLPVSVAHQHHSILVTIETGVSDVPATRELHQILREIRAHSIGKLRLFVEQSVLLDTPRVRDSNWKKRAHVA